MRSTRSGSRYEWHPLAVTTHRRVVAGLDGSHTSLGALAYASGWATPNLAGLVVVHANSQLGPRMTNAAYAVGAIPTPCCAPPDPVWTSPQCDVCNIDTTGVSDRQRRRRLSAGGRRRRPPGGRDSHRSLRTPTLPASWFRGPPASHILTSDRRGCTVRINRVVGGHNTSLARSIVSTDRL